MNTNDFAPWPWPEDGFHTIFDKHKELFYRYLDNEPYEITPETFDINVASDQFLLKDFLQIRFIEELNEVTMDLEHKDHVLEEIVDAFNFLLSVYIWYGWDYSNLDEWDDKIYKNNLDTNTLYVKMYRCIEQVGRTCNLLKNSRCWKSCQYLVDLYKFDIEFKKIWNRFNDVVSYLGFSKEDIFNVWSQKYQVNMMRLETNY